REFVDSRLRRSPPDRASAVPYGQGGENAMRFTPLAHRSAAAHKLHSTPQQDRMNLISGKGETSSRLPTFSLFLPGSCPNYRDRRRRTEGPRAAWPCSSEVPGRIERVVIRAILPRQARSCDACCVSAGRRVSFPTIRSTTLSVYPLAWMRLIS